MNSIWLVQKPGQYNVHREPANVPGAVEYIPAKDYNELIDWIGEFKSCEWAQNDDGAWDTCCGNAFEFMNGGPAENKAAYCCYCGNKLVEQPQEGRK